MADKRTCFIISTIGEEGSSERLLANEKYDLVFEPVLAELNYEVTRADKVGTPGSISYDIVQRIITSDLVIADVSDLNPNVFYELAIRNAVKKPVVVIKGVKQKMPFDIYDKRAISIDMKEARLWTNAKKELKTQISEAEKDAETASKSILSEFSFQIDTTRKLSPDTELTLQMKDMRNEIKRLRDELREKHVASEEQDLSEWEEEIRLTGGMSRDRVSKIPLFLDVLKSLEGEERRPVERELFIGELIKTRRFNRDSAFQMIRKLLRESTIYESEPGHYNRV